jgi:hypothetical protein
MSLLTQFYPGPGGSSTFPDGVPAMTLGGYTSSSKSSIYYLSSGSINGTITPAVGAGAGWASGTSSTRNFLQSSTNPICGYSVTGVSFGVLNVSGYLNPLTNEGSTLVFENTGYVAASNTLTVALTKSIYGLFLNVGGLYTLTADSRLTGWYYGGLDASVNSSTFTITASSLTDVTTCFFGFTRINTGNTLNMSGTALSAASVDHVLACIDKVPLASFGTGNTLNLGGTCSAPTAAGLVSKASLIAKGCTVVTN